MTLATLRLATLPGLGRARTDGIGAQCASAATMLSLLLIPILLSPFSGPLGWFVTAAAAFTTVAVYVVASVRIGNQRDLSGLLVVPLVISATQNVYLGVLAPHAAGFAIQLSLLTGVVYATLLFGAYALARPRAPVHPLVFQLLLVAFAILAFAVISVAALKAGLVPMATSARNMLAPFLFLMLGLLLAERVRLANFMTLVAALAWATIAFGMVEYFASRELWAALNIEALWTKKGLPNIADWGLPANFVSSEKFFGEHLRRMVSSYADPVNFGTVLFLFFMVAWLTGRRALMVACLVSVALAVSKGALMSLLIFALVWAWHRGGRIALVAAAAGALALGSAVVVYATLHSTQSLAAHVGGLVGAIESLPEHPFGRGLGGAGVLSKNADEIRESGLGLIIGQLGVLALPLFGVLFWGLWRWLIRVADPRQRVFGQALFLAIGANIAFNEVALSPNSSAGYFMLLGLVIGAVPQRRAESLR